MTLGHAICSAVDDCKFLAETVNFVVVKVGEDNYETHIEEPTPISYNYKDVVQVILKKIA